MQLFGNRPRRYEAPIGRVSSSLLQWFGAALVGIVALTLYGAIELTAPTSTTDVVLVLVLLFAITAARETSRWLASPFSRVLLVAAVPALLLAGVVQVERLFGSSSVHVVPVALATAVAALVLVLSSVLARLSGNGLAPVRIAVIGSERSAESLRRELALARVRTYTVVGWISPYRGDVVASAPTGADELGPLNALAPLVRQHRIDLLLMTGEASRQAVFDEIAASCLHLPVRFCELSSFHEDLFGHVTVTEINTAWFQYIMHPRYHSGISAAKRAVDLVGSALMSVLFLPLLAVLSVLIKLDGGPVFFGQARIGEGGRPFTVWKLRTMHEQIDSARWAAEDDDRVTWIGRLLRRTHIDELPQLLNILRGQMSLVGPRPEQPEFVERLERAVPFYTRRHLIKPGLTGWAQVRCGYEGSDEGSLWKVSHDLYYLKHRSMALDFAILWETVLTLLRPKPHNVDAETVGWLFDEPGSTPPADLPDVVAVTSPDLALSAVEASGS
jgi:exopolysaccharide biosynthesis polyprenyl glycosylphosphotransferase